MTQIPKGKVRVNLYLPPDLRDWFRTYCKEQRISQPTAFEMLVSSWRDGQISLPVEPQMAPSIGASNGKGDELAVEIAAMQTELGNLRDRLSALEQESSAAAPAAAEAASSKLPAAATNGKAPTAAKKKAPASTKSKSTATRSKTAASAPALGKTATAASTKSAAGKSTGSKSSASKSTAKSTTKKPATKRATTPTAKTATATKKKSPAKSPAKKSPASSKSKATAPAAKKKASNDGSDAGSLTSREAWQLACDRGYKGEFESFRKTATRPGWERYGIQKVGARPRRDARNWERLY